MDELRFEIDALTRSSVRALLTEHLADMHATTPVESVHALDVAGLSSPSVTVWTAWEGTALLGCAALKELSPVEGEIKSMRTAPASRGRGVAGRMLAHVLASARSRGYRRLSLETGAQEFFAPARRLYARHGFSECAPFGKYRPDPLSVFMTREL